MIVERHLACEPETCIEMPERTAMTFPIEDIRARFPSLAMTDDDRARIYLDNPAGTQVPQAVMDAITGSFLNANANLGGHFRTSRAADRIVEEAHAAMADFFGTDDAGEVIIGASTTSLGFHMSRSICRDFVPGDEIVVTRMDHDGNVAPWLEAAEDRGLVVRWVEFDRESWRIEPQALRAALTPRTRLVALNYASNMTGAVNDVAALVAEAKTVGALSYVDAVQLAPHSLIDVAALGCDFLVCSPYKFFGPHLGVLWGRRELLTRLHAYKCRCVPGDLPAKFETGTLPSELLAGLTAAVDHIAGLGQGDTRRARLRAAFAASEAYEAVLTRHLIAGLQALPDVRIIGPTANNAPRVPTVSFRHDSIKPDHFARVLAAENIFVWSGHNYAIGIVAQLGIPEAEGALRIGPANYNTVAEIDSTLAVIKQVIDAG